MKIKKKLRDVTEEEAEKYVLNDCEKNANHFCVRCVFGYVNCNPYNPWFYWFEHKDMFSDKFLDQEIEIEVEDVE